MPAEWMAMLMIWGTLLSLRCSLSVCPELWCLLTWDTLLSSPHLVQKTQLCPSKEVRHLVNRLSSCSSTLCEPTAPHTSHHIQLPKCKKIHTGQWLIRDSWVASVQETLRDKAEWNRIAKCEGGIKNGKKQIKKEYQEKEKGWTTYKDSDPRQTHLWFFFPTEMSVLKLAENTPASHIP